MGSGNDHKGGSPAHEWTESEVTDLGVGLSKPRIAVDYVTQRTASHGKNGAWAPTNSKANQQRDNAALSTGRQ